MLTQSVVITCYTNFCKIKKDLKNLFVNLLEVKEGRRQNKMSSHHDDLTFMTKTKTSSIAAS